MTSLHPLRQLLSAAGPGLGPQLDLPPALGEGSRAELAGLLMARNGFYAFDSALHVLATADRTSLAEWNLPDGWRAAFGPASDDFLFFAQDAFGNQFAIRDDAVWLFDTESGEAERLAPTFNEWACQLPSRHAEWTGSRIAREWQVKHGPLARGFRLAPKVPFILGGSFGLENLYALEQLKLLRFRGDLYNQLEDLPDGSRVVLKPIGTV